MKTFIFLSIFVASLFSGQSSNGGKPDLRNIAVIHYQVNIQNNLLGQVLCPMAVFLTDGMGNAVGSPQPYRSYIATYHFYEIGPVQGSRIAHLEIIPKNSNVVCVLPPDAASMNGTFNNGSTYQFFMRLGTSIPSPIPQPVPGC